MKRVSDFASRLKEYREQSGLTQLDMSKQCGIPYQTLSRYELRQRIPKVDTAVEIAEALGINPLWLQGYDVSKDILSLDLGDGQTAVPPIMGHIDTGKTKLFPYSPAAMDLARDFDTLDSHGQSAVRGLMDEELNRMAELDELAKFQEPEEEKHIPRYLSPYAAGVASPIFGEEYEDYTLQSGDPKGAVFAVKVQGDSMEPYIKDGSTVFCNKDPMLDGDIGVFIVDGAGVIKQYHKEGGIVYLFSLNRKRADADIMLPPSSGRNLSCQGRVITKRKFPVPGR